jgi:hypothetical protein
MPNSLGTGVSFRIKCQECEGDQSPACANDRMHGAIPPFSSHIFMK